MKILNKYQWSILSLIIGILFVANTISGQGDREILKEIGMEEQEAVNAIVLYPEETRIAILNASLHPEALIKMESIQSRTRTSFVELVQDYPQEVQEEIWDLSRYPNLINMLIITPESELENALSEYPEVIHNRAKKVAKENYDLLNRVDELDFIAESTYKSILKDYPEDIQISLNHLLDHPEVLTILMDNIRLTILVGKAYEKDPEWVLHKADSLHLKLATENAKELEEWKQSLEVDPESVEQLRLVSEEYEDDQDYFDDEYYNYDKRNNDVTVNYYYEYNYPYWYGYPTWYSYPRWRMYPYWYDWGFYYGPYDRIVILGLPSYNFTYWYFGVPHHHKNYYHLSTHFANHYYGHRNSTGSVTAGVSNWRNNNRSIVSDRWIKEDGNLKERFQEFGRAEVKRTEYNRKNPDRELSQREFVLKNRSQFPSLSKSVAEVKTERTDISINRKNTEIPRTKTELPSPKERKVKKQDEPNPRVKTDPRNSKVYKRNENEQSTNIPNTRKAKDFHKSTWEKTTSERTKVQVPKTKTRKTPVTRKPVTKKPVARKTNPVKKKNKGN